MAVASLAAMLNAASPLGQREIERALTLTLFPAPTAAQRRVAQLGELADMLGRFVSGELRTETEPAFIPEDDVFAASVKWSQVPRGFSGEDYDRMRSAAAPSSKQLVETYGSWLRVCRAAHGLLPDGRYLGVGRPWPGRRAKDYDRSICSREEALESIRHCARELGLVPVSSDYYRWQQAKAVLRRERGSSEKTPITLPPIYKLFGNFEQAVVEAALDPEEVAAQRAARHGRFVQARREGTDPAARWSALSSRERETLGLSAEEQSAADEDRFGELPLTVGSRVARQLGGSLEWLAGASPVPGSLCPALEGLDGEAFARRRRDVGLAEQDLLEVMEWIRGDLRRIINGTVEVTVSELLRLAGLLNVPPLSLTKAG